MAVKLKVVLPKELWPFWEQWATKHVPWETEPDRPVPLGESELLKVATFLPGNKGRASNRIWLPSGHILPDPQFGPGARLFDDASSMYLEVDSAPVTAAPFTMAAWANSDSQTVDQAILFVGDKDADNLYWQIRLKGATAGDFAQFQSRSAAANVQQATSTGYTAGTWHHIAGVEGSATDHRAYIDGGLEGASTTSVTPTGADRISVGRTGRVSAEAYFSGDLAEASIWSDDFVAADVALIAKPVSALMVHPESLVFYLPIIGRFSPEIDLVGGLGLTVTNAPTASPHPRIFYIPAPSIKALPAVAANPPPGLGPAEGELLERSSAMTAVLSRF